ncbi:hypothetical protein BROUX41_004472 [Berkeleyomyces rouxiae]
MPAELFDSVVGSASAAFTAPSAVPGVLGPASLPAGFPLSFDSKQVWTGSDFKNDQSYILQLSPEDIEELKSALKHYKTLGLGPNLISPDSFPLPILAPKLLGISEDLHNGRGFALIRGLDPKDFSVADLSTIWLGVQSFIAKARGRQDKKGNMIVHIIADSSSAVKAGHHRHSRSAITFHTEETGDITSWITRSAATSGGRCIIASAHKIYNTMASVSPSMIRTLAKSDWPFALPHFQCRPVMFYRGERLIMNFGRAALTGNATHPRPASLPSLTPQQLEALDAVEAVAQATQLEIQTQPGDMHFINNLCVLHRRDAFVDGSEPPTRRHLVRMRLRCDLRGWDVPAELRGQWEEAFGEKRDRVWHLEPMPDRFFPLRMYAN